MSAPGLGQECGPERVRRARGSRVEEYLWQALGRRAAEPARDRGATPSAQRRDGERGAGDQPPARADDDRDRLALLGGHERTEPGARQGRIWQRLTTHQGIPTLVEQCAGIRSAGDLNAERHGRDRMVMQYISRPKDWLSPCRDSA